jgi:putative AdoMet-dependent methyltransferase
MSKQNRRHIFDEWAEQYDNTVESEERPFPFSGYKQVLNEIVRQARAQANMEVLDLGVGTGNLAQYFVNAGCVVWGIDFSSKMIKKAQRKLPQVKFVQADLLGKWPAALNRKFGCIVSAYVLHEFDLENKIKLLKKLTSTYLLKNGRVIIGDIAFASIQDRKQAYEKWKDKWDEDEFYWATDEIIWSCKKAGLQVKFIQVSVCAGVYVFKPTIFL